MIHVLCVSWTDSLTIIIFHCYCRHCKDKAFFDLTHQAAHTSLRPSQALPPSLEVHGGVQAGLGFETFTGGEDRHTCVTQGYEVRGRRLHRVVQLIDVHAFV